MLVMSSTAVVCSQQARCCIVRSDLLLRQPTPSVNGVLVHEALASNLQPSTPAYIVMNPRVLVCKGSQSRSRRAHVAGLERHVLDRKAEGRYGIKSQQSVGCAIASVVRQLLRPQASQGDTNLRSEKESTVDIVSLLIVSIWKICRVVVLETIDEPVATNRDQLRWLMDMIGL